MWEAEATESANSPTLSAAIKCLPWGSVGVQIGPGTSYMEHKAPVLLVFDIIVRLWRTRMVTVDISTGVKMKQRESNIDEAEKGEGRRHHK